MLSFLFWAYHTGDWAIELWILSYGYAPLALWLWLWACDPERKKPAGSWR